MKLSITLTNEIEIDPNWFRLERNGRGEIGLRCTDCEYVLFSGINAMGVGNLLQACANHWAEYHNTKKAKMEVYDAEVSSVVDYEVG